MKNMILWGLVLLNALLLTAFIGRISGSDSAVAQNRRPADYVLIPANIAEDGSSAVVYMLDSTNGVLGGMVFDDSRKELNTMAPINIERVFQAGENVNTAAPARPGSRRGTGPGAPPPGGPAGGAVKTN